MSKKREVLLDRTSVIEKLKDCGYEEDILLGMSDKSLYELYNESDLVNYHASDATKDEYTIGLGDDIELDEVKTLYEPGDELPTDLDQNSNDVEITDKGVTVTSKSESRFDKKTLKEKFAKNKVDESFEADKKLVMEMINKHYKPSATKGKIMEYILKNS